MIAQVLAGVSLPLRTSRLTKISCSFFFFFFFCLYRAAPTAYRSFQARGRIGTAAAKAANLHHSHNNVGSELCLRPIP